MAGGQHPEGALTVKDLARALLAEGVTRIIGIAELPDIVRGYEDVKLANVARYRKQGEQLISELRMQTPQL